MIKAIKDFLNRGEHLKHRIDKTVDELGFDPRLIAIYDSASLLGEQYQMIRTNISLALANEEGMKTMIVTSSLASEGKSVTSANLALTFAKDPDKKTVLIDADMRRPTQHKLFKIDRSPGLSNILKGRVDVTECVREPKRERLWVIPVGDVVDNPRELIGGPHMRPMIEKLKESFDYIIIDTPPILSVSDSQILASMVDMSILAVRANATQEKQIKDALRSLNEANPKLVGTIFTGYVEYSAYYSQSYKQKYKYYRRKK